MTEIDDMRAFVEVVESGGLSPAARRLGLSKSIVSRRIARLEEQLGAQLLSRTTRGISPTEAGADFKARSERILAELDEAREAMAHHRGDVVGRLRLSAPITFGVRHVAPLLAMLAERHPRLEVDLALSDRRVDLVAEGFDAAVRIGTPEDSTLVARRITTIYAALAASPDYIAEHGQPQAPEDLARHQCLLYSGMANADWTFAVGKRSLSVRPRGRLRSDNGEAILEWAIAGRGIAALPVFLLSDALERKLLVPVLTGYRMPEAALHVLRPPGQNVPGKVRALIDAMVERFGGEPVWDRCMMAAREAAEAEAALVAA